MQYEKHYGQQYHGPVKLRFNYLKTRLDLARGLVFHDTDQIAGDAT
jgi:hypothetical protein